MPKNVKNLDKDIKCDKKCFVHENFHLNLKEERECKCGKMFPNEVDQPNKFTFILPVQGERGLLAICDKIMTLQEKKDVSSNLSN
jgi:hypothetical protein